LIIVQTPLRVSFFGGGTDFPSFFQKEEGCVLSTAIDKYIFVTIKKRFDDKIRVGYTKTELVDSINEIQHELIREAFRFSGVERGVEITTMGDIPAGSGLGSSSTVTVGALHAMYAHQSKTIPIEQIARQACEIEIKNLHKPIGIQDQYIATYGGFRFFRFMPDSQVITEKVELSDTQKQRLNENLLLFYTGITRKAETILDEQKTNISKSMYVLQEIKGIAFEAYRQLKSGNLDCLGNLLHESWQLKKKLASQISNGKIDEWYSEARKQGALGGKITGAGGGGFLLLYCPYEYRDKVRTVLSHLREVPIRLETDGSKVIFNYRQ
jgi:D-glycero-alpha-D-manno-heptose-7-phosphate kinase